MLEMTGIIVQSLLKTNRRQYKMAAAFTSDFVAKVNIGKCPDDRGCLCQSSWYLRLSRPTLVLTNRKPFRAFFVFFQHTLRDIRSTSAVSALITAVIRSPESAL